jgi:hypothetical protein
MALFSQATDLKTRQTIWVGTNILKGKSQGNSHTRNWDYDGLTAVELAYLHTDYHGNFNPS